MERLSFCFFLSLVFSLVLVSTESFPSQDKLQILWYLLSCLTLEPNAQIVSVLGFEGIIFFYSRPAEPLN